MKKYFKLSLTWTVSIITFVFMFLPDDIFKTVKLLPNAPEWIEFVLSRVLLFAMILVATFIVVGLFLLLRTKVRIKARDYTIEIMYGDLFKQKKCKKLIPFDECFTTSVGPAPSDINPSSICGQYLKLNPNLAIDSLIASAGLKSKGKSKYDGKDRYESGSLINYSDYLLMAFVKLDKDGLGRMTYSEYINALSVLWEELDKHYGQNNVCIPILGAGTTRLKDASLTKQELLDIIIASYRLAQSKIHKPNKLVIICRKGDVSLNKIGKFV